MKTVYEKKEGVNANGEFIITDNEGLTAIFKDVMAQIGTKLLEGNMVDLMKISRPARCTTAKTHLSCLASDLRYSHLLSLAAKLEDPIERMKYVTVFLLSGLHISPSECRSKAPLNPILGETFQASKLDGSEIYLEQTFHHPPTSNYYMMGPNKEFEIFGFCVTKAGLSGMNSLKGSREGKNIIRFADGTLYSYSVPDLRINNLILGERVVNFHGTLNVRDYKNKIESISTFPYKDVGTIQNVGNAVLKIFKGKEATQYDEFNLTITKLNQKTKIKELVSEGYGSVFGQIYIDNRKLWSYDDPYEEWIQKPDSFILESDSFKREDYKSLLPPANYQKAQKVKDELENLQRKDKKLRESHKK